VSLEFTGELNDEGFSVTECLGGSMELTEDELGLRYQVSETVVVIFAGNPRPSRSVIPGSTFEQSLGTSFPGQRCSHWLKKIISDVAFLISKYLKEQRTGKTRSPDGISRVGKERRRV
jgi:hypothetical protein